MMGVDKTESNSRPNAAKSIIDSGVAGRNMVTGGHAAKPRVEKVVEKKEPASSRRGWQKKKCPLALGLKRCCRPLKDIVSCAWHGESANGEDGLGLTWETTSWKRNECRWGVLVRLCWTRRVEVAMECDSRCCWLGDARCSVVSA
jgi:hypothetical protein